MLRKLLLALVLWWPGIALAAPHTVAVLYFDNGGDAQYDALKVGLTQMLINDLVGTPEVKVVERTDLQAILDELKLGHSAVTDPKTAARVGRLLGAEWLVLGTYFELGGKLFVQSRILRVETGEILAARSLQDAPGKFLDLEHTLAGAWRTTLTGLAGDGTPSRPAAPAESTGQAPPERVRGASEPADTRVATPDAKALGAAVAYSEGLIYLDTKDLPRAREAFEQAVADDPRLDDAKAQLSALHL